MKIAFSRCLGITKVSSERKAGEAMPKNLIINYFAQKMDSYTKAILWWRSLHVSNQCLHDLQDWPWGTEIQSGAFNCSLAQGHSLARGILVPVYKLLYPHNVPHLYRRKEELLGFSRYGIPWLVRETMGLPFHNDNFKMLSKQWH